MTTKTDWLCDIFQIVAVGGRINHQKHFIMLNVTAIGVPILVFMFTFSEVIGGGMTIYSFVSLVSPIMSFVVTKGTFIFFLVSLRIRFQVLNRCFDRNFCCSKSPVKFVKSLEPKEEEDPSLVVTKFAILHDNISDAAELTSLCYSFQVRPHKSLWDFWTFKFVFQAMIFTGLCFVYNVFLIFSIFRVWLHHNEGFFALVFSNIEWSFITYGFVLGEIHVAHKVTKLVTKIQQVTMRKYSWLWILIRENIPRFSLTKPLIWLQIPGA